MKTNPISASSDLQVVQTRPRQTALPPSRRFASELKNNLAAGAGSLLRIGGAVMGAALPAGDPGLLAGASSTSLSGANPLGSRAGSQGAMMDQSMELLALQQQIQMENQQYTTLSNVLKARHETNKNAISNLR